MKPSKRFVILFLAPAALLYISFFLIPTLQTFYYSLFNWSGVGDDLEFRGFGNYSELINDSVFVQSLSNTLIILLIGGAIIFGLAFLFTALLNTGVQGKRFFRAIIFLPNIVATIALTTLWGNLYNPRFGAINTFLKSVGLETLGKTQWTAADKIFWAMLIALIWTYVGFYLVLLMAGVDRIPMDYYEAAKLDGANQFQMFFKITVPLLWDVLTIAIVLWSIAALKIFEFPFAFTALEPVRETYTVAVYLYIMGFGQRTPIWRMGYASAIGVLLLVIIVIIVVLLRRLMHREVIQF